MGHRIPNLLTIRYRLSIFRFFRLWTNIFNGILPVLAAVKNMPGAASSCAARIPKNTYNL